MNAPILQAQSLSRCHRTEIQKGASPYAGIFAQPLPSPNAVEFGNEQRRNNHPDGLTPMKELLKLSFFVYFFFCVCV